VPILTYHTTHRNILGLAFLPALNLLRMMMTLVNARVKLTGLNQESEADSELCNGQGDVKVPRDCILTIVEVLLLCISGGFEAKYSIIIYVTRHHDAFFGWLRRWNSSTIATFQDEQIMI
jgi:hypothetical protein